MHSNPKHIENKQDKIEDLTKWIEGFTNIIPVAIVRTGSYNRQV